MSKIKIKYNKCYTVKNLVNKDGTYSCRNVVVSKVLSNFDSTNPCVMTYTDGINFALVDVIDSINGDKKDYYILKWQKLVDRNLPQFSTLSSEGFTNTDINLADANRWLSLSTSYVFMCKKTEKILVPITQNPVPKVILRRYLTNELLNSVPIQLNENETIGINEILKKDNIEKIKTNLVYSCDFKQINPQGFSNFIALNENKGLAIDVKIRFPKGLRKNQKETGLITIGDLVDQLSLSDDFEATMRYYDDNGQKQEVLFKEYIDSCEYYFEIDRNEKIHLERLVEVFEKEFNLFRNKQ